MAPQAEAALRLETAIETNVGAGEYGGLPHGMAKHTVEIDEGGFALVIDTTHIGLHQHCAPVDMQPAHVFDGLMLLAAIDRSSWTAERSTVICDGPVRSTGDGVTRSRTRLHKHLPRLRPRGVAAGLHLMIELDAAVDERAVVAAAERRSIRCTAPAPTEPTRSAGHRR